MIITDKRQKATDKFENLCVGDVFLDADDCLCLKIDTTSEGDNVVGLSTGYTFSCDEDEEVEKLNNVEIIIK